MGFPCPVQGCAYVGQNGRALQGHVSGKHADEMRPLPTPPSYQTIAHGDGLAAIYLRVSTVDQHPEKQLPACLAFAGMRGYTVGKRPDGRAAIYEDKASGKTTERPELGALIADVLGNPGLYNAVIFRRLSRLGRSLRDNILLFDQFQMQGVALISVEEPYDTTTPAGRLIRNVMSSVAEYERENIVEYAREAVAQRRAEGRLMGRHPAACGVPTSMGGLGPCPEGVDHDVPQMITAAKEAERRKVRERQRRSRERRAQIGNANARARVTNPSLLAGGSALGDTSAKRGV